MAVIFCYGISTAVCFAVPLGFLVWSLVKKKEVVKPFCIGMLVFFVSQIVLRIPLITLLFPKMSWYESLQDNIAAASLFSGLTAGIFEELGRYAGYKIFLKKNTRYIDGFAYGVGHGGFEAMYLVGLTCINNLIFMVAINSGTFDLLCASLPSETRELIYTQLSFVTPGTALLVGAERIFAMVFHVAMSLFLLYGIRKKTVLPLIAAVVIHGAYDGMLGILSGVFHVGLFGLELYLGIIAILMLLFIVKLRKL